MAKIQVIGSLFAREIDDPGEARTIIEKFGEQLTRLSFKDDRGVKHSFYQVSGSVPAESLEEFKKRMGIDSKEATEQKGE